MEEIMQGMMWYDDSDLPLNEKIDNAVKYFKKKHNRDCKVVALHPKTFINEEVPEEINGIKIRVSNKVLMHHLFVGDDDTPYGVPYPEEGAQI